MSYSSGALLDQAVEYVTVGRPILGIGRIGKLQLPSSSAEFQRCKEIKGILEDYSSRTEVPRPLSIAVFGPPGSGKSFCVENLISSFDTRPMKERTINLSQVPDLEGLGSMIRAKLKAQEEGSQAKILFFDEFDGPLGAEALGWLRWFLAPMQDGEFLDEGKPVTFGKAILFFAGGTAPTLEEFERRAKSNEREYREKKVPDFISRLRGFIDIQGVNGTDEARPVRRALVLRHQLQKRWPGNTAEPPISAELARKLLATAHFVHGVRSMEALLDTSIVPAGETFEEKHLPSTELRRLHISRGPLDGRAIGVSAGLDEKKTWVLLEELTQALLGSGATIAYGGDFIPGGTLDHVVAAANEVPDDLIERDDSRLRNYLCYPSHLNPDVQDHHRMAQGYVDFRKLETLSEGERRELGVPPCGWFRARGKDGEPYDPKHHLGWAISLFRMRARLVMDVDALIVMGGKDEESWGRFSGIAEEVMLAMAMKKPVYLLGGCGGATEAVGRLLGLGESVVYGDGYLRDPGPVGDEKAMAGRFDLPGYGDLPQSIAALRKWLQERSVWTPYWPENGLNLEENRRIFGMPLPNPAQKECVDTILSGLMRLLLLVGC
ncbi:MAG: hypothetical protein JNK48_24360 [Bryobacterales bacterium]|nr:hypothetical protein [Bryobacterales bacterium]